MCIYGCLIVSSLSSLIYETDSPIPDFGQTLVANRVSVKNQIQNGKQCIVRLDGSLRAVSSRFVLFEKVTAFGLLGSKG